MVGVHSRLNRFLVRDRGSSWLDGVIQEMMFKFFLDYLPILLDLGVFLQIRGLLGFLMHRVIHQSCTKLLRRHGKGVG